MQGDVNRKPVRTSIAHFLLNRSGGIKMCQTQWRGEWKPHNLYAKLTVYRTAQNNRMQCQQRAQKLEE